MNTKADTAARDQEIAEDYLDGKTVRQLVREHGLKERRIYQILAARGIRRTPPTAQQRAEAKPSRDRKLEAIGRRLHDYYLLECKMTRVEAAEALGCSAKVLRSMEIGAYEFTFHDLQDIAAFMKIHPGELFDVG